MKVCKETGYGQGGTSAGGLLRKIYLKKKEKENPYKIAASDSPWLRERKQGEFGERGRH